MPLVTLKEVLSKAHKENYAVGAFNVENMEMVQAVISAAEELNSPVIIQTTSSTLKYAGPEMFYANVSAAAKKSKIPVVMHLDHGNSYEIAEKSFYEGYTSIMIDGSKLAMEENIELTKRVVELCSGRGVSVEAELGSIGGKEDEHEAENRYTDAKDAEFFVNATKIDALAIAIGTAHGIYKSKPNIDLNRLEEIRQKVDVPLVLHGTSGVEDDTVKECIKRGICKVNYATDLRIAFTKGVKEVLDLDVDVYDPKKYLSRGRDKVKEYVMRKIEVCMSAGKGYSDCKYKK